MDGLRIAIPFLLCAALLAACARCLVLRRKIRRLAEKMEDFLCADGKPLAFSVQEDAIAPLHNAAAETQYRLLLARERQAEELKRTIDLTADISHQLKTPLASLRLFCEMDACPHLTEQLGQIERMERLIHALLRLERLCADGYAFTFAVTDVGAIVREAWESLGAAYPGRELTVTGACALRCDAKWLGEAFVNLLKNACEHTPPGGQIRVSMECAQTSFVCAVENDGEDVAETDLPRLFDRFYSARGRERTGAGIGLAIVREIIRRHHGDIRAVNTGKGLKMLIHIPIYNLAKP